MQRFICIQQVLCRNTIRPWRFVQGQLLKWCQGDKRTHVLYMHMYCTCIAHVLCNTCIVQHMYCTCTTILNNLLGRTKPQTSPHATRKLDIAVRREAVMLMKGLNCCQIGNGEFYDGVRQGCGVGRIFNLRSQSQKILTCVVVTLGNSSSLTFQQEMIMAIQ